jgi:hypothetical protein
MLKHLSLPLNLRHVCTSLTDPWLLLQDLNNPIYHSFAGTEIYLDMFSVKTKHKNEAFWGFQQAEIWFISGIFVLGK